MLRLHPKNLFLSSLFITLIVSCSPSYKYKLSRTEVITESDIHSIINKDSSLLYKAKINLYTNYYSGIILLKQINPTTSHLLFITELGMKMFEFEIQNNQFKLIYVFEPLNKQRVLEIIEKDMKLILLQNLVNKKANVFEQKNQVQHIFQTSNEKLKYYHFIQNNTNVVNKIIVKGSVFTKAKVNYSYNNNLKATNIKLKHRGIFSLKIELNKISTTLKP